MADDTRGAPLLEIADLRIGFGDKQREAVAVVRGVSLRLERGRILGLVGESGSGKSLTCRAIMRLLPEAGHVLSGRISFDGRNVLELDRPDLLAFRSTEVGMIFQDPFSSLNPTRRIGSQMVEALRLALRLPDRGATKRAIELLAEVDIPDPAAKLRMYPHELSGGMRQRVMLAIAMGAKPRLLIADEPTTALDTTTQAQILQLLRRVKDDTESSILLVSHDFGVIAEMCDDVAVMYDGYVVESGPVEEVYLRPQHPYTRALIAAVPTLTVPERGYRRPTIPGPPLGTTRYDGGCPFTPRCAFARPECRNVSMTLLPVGPAHTSACPFEGSHR
ncbi:oligopeptide/dipeptide ABC transporter ATP-binding protein [Microbacterium sp. AK009]|uniref:ABC transporter ATP-binding protein n=1 Tax=Microbacterium sp. AK009 TaxID=2723068 RepID=UPI0015CD413A|nr:ABC transporter ATP-binding protein [Microbacterium sp. AK009]NYF16633.1 oligopeptide/dipeptide ABC transporter ATP-binding protein [Microbacterium sp. AK009]